jgi:hypothetical protein
VLLAASRDLPILGEQPASRQDPTHIIFRRFIGIAGTTHTIKKTVTLLQSRFTARSPRAVCLFPQDVRLGNILIK